MTLLSQLAALAAIVGTGVVYGTDTLCPPCSGRRVSASRLAARR
jgi:hypothetical protein